ncbi:CPBP family intramembrane glutamic endopeptidase [Paenibacillus sp. NPDC058071]|uniref:CPBP family intramembrane glutamic endopeptidase n=1 Tax=Paenibacillus sp. NPDC058071 TaxID=3346326 RepID=UPI0036D969A1
MIHSIEKHDWKRFIVAALIGLLIFIAAQLIPLAGGEASSDVTFAKAIAKSEAEAAARSFSKQQFGLAAQSADVIHQTDSLASGYFSKEKKLGEYEKKYSSNFPTDAFQVHLKLEDGSNAFIYVHMTSSSIVGWHWKTGFAVNEQPLIAAAESFAVSKGFSKEQLTDRYVNDDGEVVFHPSGYKLADASLNLTVGVRQLNGDEWTVTRYKPVFEPPADYTAHVKKQQDIAGSISVVSLIYMYVFTLVLAIIYAVLYRRNTTFKRGIAISLIFTFFYIFNNLNLLDGVKAQLGEQATTRSSEIAMMFVTALMLLPIGVAVYFSLVAGDGMWRSWKKPLWSGFRERGYGDHVWRSVGLSYLFAIILLGIQSIIFLVLENAIGSWSSSDATQSPYNMSVLWIMPMLAWCAAISEEAIYRLFGVAIFKRWFRNTFIACLIPTVMWAIGHVGYPIFPFYTRVIELIIIGLIFCYIFLRYGFVTAVFTHAIFDSLLMSLSLVGVGGTVNVTAAIIYIILPVPIAWVIRAWHRNRHPRQPAALNK